MGAWQRKLRRWVPPRRGYSGRGCARKSAIVRRLFGFFGGRWAKPIGDDLKRLAIGPTVLAGGPNADFLQVLEGLCDGLCRLAERALRVRVKALDGVPGVFERQAAVRSVPIKQRERGRRSLAEIQNWALLFLFRPKAQLSRRGGDKSAGQQDSESSSKCFHNVVSGEEAIFEWGRQGAGGRAAIFREQPSGCPEEFL